MKSTAIGLGKYLFILLKHLSKYITSGIFGALRQVPVPDPRRHDAPQGDEPSPPSRVLRVRRLRRQDRRKVLQHRREGRLQ